MNSGVIRRNSIGAGGAVARMGGASGKARMCGIATRFWTYGLLTVSAVLMVNALIGEKGYLANLQAQREFKAASNALVQIEAENAALEAKIKRLRQDPQALEDFAREKLGLVKPDETLIILRDRPTDRN
ncbi:MAG: septum formation initiator family protein [Acidobacteria bacterium]|nr:septum formation initiator family protein [Acidobacteriota bacterium]